MIELIKKLTEAWGPSGYEHHIRALIQAEVANLADEIITDPLGNLICRVGKGGSKVMVSAHMDEIGIMATFTEPHSGFLRFDQIGGLNKHNLRGNRVKFEDGTIGVVGMQGTGEALTDFYVDVDGGDDITRVPQGSPAGFWRELDVRGNRLVNKAMDDRIGCVVAIEAMRRLNKKSPNEVYFVFSVQEEVGLRGAKTAATRVNPDVGIALDVTATGDEAHARKMAVALGKGAAIKIHDPGLVVPPSVINWMVGRAEADNIPYQRELLSGGTTDASAIQVAGWGVPSGCISIPCRYIHTVSETVDLRDVQACVDLLTGLLANPAPFPVEL